MKKISISMLFLILLAGCASPEDSVEVVYSNSLVDAAAVEARSYYTVGSKQTNVLNVYGNVLNNNVKELPSHTNGTVDYLQCEVGQVVTSDTVIAKITPDQSDLVYKNNMIQRNSLSDQLLNQRSIRTSTVLNFDSQTKQLNFQKDNLESQLASLQENLIILKDQKNITGDDLFLQLESLNKQIQILEESKDIAEKNKTESLVSIREDVENIKGQIYNTGIKSFSRLDETFAVSDENMNSNREIRDLLGVKNSVLKNEVSNNIEDFLSLGKDPNLKNWEDEEISQSISDLASLLKDAAQVVKDSIASNGKFEQSTIDGMYNEFLSYSDALLGYKTNYDRLLNSINTTQLTFDGQLKTIESNLESLKTQKTNLESNQIQSSDLNFDTNINNSANQIKSLEFSLDNILEQIDSIVDSKNSTLKQIDIQISQMQDAIARVNVALEGEEIKAGIDGVVKGKKVKEGNSVQAGGAVCVVVPKEDSLKLEIYSPNSIALGSEFAYYKDEAFLGSGSIISESPVKDLRTQNYIYDGKIDFVEMKEGDYLSIKVKIAGEELTATKAGIWIPIDYLKPKLDGYFVVITDEHGLFHDKKIEVGRMNYGEIEVISGLNIGDVISR